MIRNTLWEEIKTANTNCICCLFYTDKARKRNRYYDIGLCLIAIIGAPTFFFNHWCAFASTLIVSIGEFSKNIYPIINQPEKELNKIDDIYKNFNDILIDLEQLWYKNERKEIQESDLEKEIALLQKRSIPITKEMNELVRKISKKENKKFMDDSDEYLRRKFY